MFIGKYQPGVISGVTPIGGTWARVEVASPAGTVIHRDTILFWMPSVAGDPENYTTSDNTFPPEATVLRGLSLLNLPINAFSHLEPPGVNFYDSFTRNALRHPSLIGNKSGFVVPTHGIPFAHSCYPNAICSADLFERTIEVRLTRPVAAFEAITLSYCPLNVGKDDRESYLKNFHGIEHHDCPRGCKQLSYVFGDPRRAEFFRLFAEMDTVLCDAEFDVQVHSACRLASEQHLEAYLWPFLSKAELHARKSKFASRGGVHRILIAVMENQGGINHPSVEFARKFEHSTSTLEDNQRVDGDINT
ncbi:uncharacterized protein Bfra_006543 [Botrytis fragariae]|uniref:SET domain-containing protein n=1 Tax=Botrytis fragariae TaxID=1964551 RepID=A0A8H6B5A0_9HELO|nr:uncharacterized protein Bfra_006543 [Botrytis fragariae]KAF5879335.1 hypothetical protein Bfra_006543 [Botrytis fragariae]